MHDCIFVVSSLRNADSSSYHLLKSTDSNSTQLLPKFCIKCTFIGVNKINSTAPKETAETISEPLMFLSEKLQSENAAKSWNVGKKTEHHAVFKIRNKIRDDELYTDHFNLNSQQIM